MVKNLLAMWETQVWSQGQEDPLEEGTAPHSSILAWRIPWTEEPGRHLIRKDAYSLCLQVCIFAWFLASDLLCFSTLEMISQPFISGFVSLPSFCVIVLLPQDAHTPFWVCISALLLS